MGLSYVCIHAYTDLFRVCMHAYIGIFYLCMCEYIEGRSQGCRTRNTGCRTRHTSGAAPKGARQTHHRLSLTPVLLAFVRLSRTRTATVSEGERFQDIRARWRWMHVPWPRQAPEDTAKLMYARDCAHACLCAYFLCVRACVCMCAFLSLSLSLSLSFSIGWSRHPCLFLSFCHSFSRVLSQSFSFSLSVSFCLFLSFRLSLSCSLSLGLCVFVLLCLGAFVSLCLCVIVLIYDVFHRILSTNTTKCLQVLHQKYFTHRAICGNLEHSNQWNYNTILKT